MKQGFSKVLQKIYLYILLWQPSSHGKHTANYGCICQPDDDLAGQGDECNGVPSQLQRQADNASRNHHQECEDLRMQNLLGT